MKNTNFFIGLIIGVGVIYALSRYTQAGKTIVQTITDAGVNMIAQFEGFSEKAYNDPPGSTKFSIGFGHQIQPGEPYMSQTITVEQGRALLAQDTANAQIAVRSAITRPLTPAQFDALTSFVYNIGPAAFKSGTVPSKVNAGDFTAVAATMREYNKAGHVVNSALVARRDVEASAFA